MSWEKDFTFQWNDFIVSIRSALARHLQQQKRADETTITEIIRSEAHVWRNTNEGKGALIRLLTSKSSELGAEAEKVISNLHGPHTANLNIQNPFALESPVVIVGVAVIGILSQILKYEVLFSIGIGVLIIVIGAPTVRSYANRKNEAAVSDYINKVIDDLNVQGKSLIEIGKKADNIDDGG